MSKVAAKIDWSLIQTKLKPDSIARLQAFRSRHAAALKQVLELREQNQTLNLAQYSVIKTQSVVSEAKVSLDSFKAQKYGLSAQLSVIEAERVKAVALAEQTVTKVSQEIVELKVLLNNIETARPIDELTVDDVAIASPTLDATIEKMAKRGQWTMPGYYEKFGEFSIGF